MRGREWIIGSWYDHIAEACKQAHVGEWAPVLVAAEGDPTVAALNARSEKQVIAVVSGETASEDVRDWTAVGRYTQMTALRNQLLDVVRRVGPDLFLSIDSDILLNRHALHAMIMMLESGAYGAVSSKTYLADDALPNYACGTAGGGLNRPDTTGTFAVDNIMAIKLMTPAAYQVDYVDDERGEDIGWSRNARRAGVRLGWTGVTTSVHIMDKRLVCDSELLLHDMAELLDALPVEAVMQLTQRRDRQLGELLARARARGVLHA